MIDPKSEEAIDHAGRVADAIVIDHESPDPFWDETARAIVKALILHVVSAEEYADRRNLVTLRNLVQRGDLAAVESLKNSGETDVPSGHGLLWAALSVNPAFDGAIAAVGETILDLLRKDSKLVASILQVVGRNTEFIDSPAMQRSLAESDFKLSGLKTARNGMSVYLCLPQRFMSTHFRWLRMMIALTINEMEIVPGKPASGYPVLMMLDEFAGLKRMQSIEAAVAQIAGFGLKLFFVLQSLEQLKAVYKDNWETFLANSGLKVFFNIEDHFSRDYVSKLIGETEVVRDVQSASDTAGESESRSHTTSQSTSESRGTSTSQGTSLSEGTNWSESDSYSEGVNSSRGTSYSHSTSTTSSWSPFAIHIGPVPLIGIGRNESSTEGSSFGSSSSEGESKTWSRSLGKGGSRGSSWSYNDGTSETIGSSVSESDGTTWGTSSSRTMGTSQTLHRRPLISPDEIGLAFGSAKDNTQLVYPGLALILIAGQRPIFVRRVNYYEDDFFVGLFSDHPDHKLEKKPLLHNITRGVLAAGKQWIPDLTCRTKLPSGALIRMGDTVAYAVSGGKGVAPITFPDNGRLIIGADGVIQIVYYWRHNINYLFDSMPYRELEAYTAKIKALQAPPKPTEYLLAGAAKPNPFHPSQPEVEKSYVKKMRALAAAAPIKAEDPETLRLQRLVEEDYARMTTRQPSAPAGRVEKAFVWLVDKLSRLI